MGPAAVAAFWCEKSRRSSSSLSSSSFFQSPRLPELDTHPHTTPSNGYVSSPYSWSYYSSTILDGWAYRRGNNEHKVELRLTVLFTFNKNLCLTNWCGRYSLGVGDLPGNQYAIWVQYQDLYRMDGSFFNTRRRRRVQSNPARLSGGP